MCIPLRARGSLSLSLSLSLSDWWRRITPDNFPQKPDCVFVLDPPFEDCGKDSVINAVEEFPHIALEDETIARSVFCDSACFAFQNVHAFMRTEPDAAREGCRDEGLFKDGIQDGKNGVMKNSVAHIGFMDMTLLRIADIEAVIRAVAVRSVFEVAVKLKNILLEIPLEFRDIRLLAFVRLERFPRFEEILRRYDALEKVAID